MPEHDVTGQKKLEKTEKNKLVSTMNSQEMYRNLMAWDISSYLGEPVFNPPIQRHATLLASASPEQKIIISRQLQQTYGNKYVQRLIESINARVESTINQPGSIYEHGIDRITNILTNSVPLQIRRQKEGEDDQKMIPARNIIQQQKDKDSGETTHIVTGSEEEAEASLRESVGLLSGGLESQYIVIILRSIGACQQLGLEESKYKWAWDEIARVAVDLLKARIETLDADECRQEITAELIKFSAEIQQLGVDEGVIQVALDKALAQAKEQLTNAVWMMRRKPDEAAAETIRRRLENVMIFGGAASPEVNDAIELLQMWIESLGWTVG